MPYYRTFKSRCSHCGWHGTVGFGDVRIGPWKEPDGTYHYPDLCCPTCRKQVNNPLSASERASLESDSSVLDVGNGIITREANNYLEGDELSREIARLLGRQN